MQIRLGLIEGSCSEKLGAGGLGGEAPWRRSEVLWGSFFHKNLTKCKKCTDIFLKMKEM